MGWEGSGLVGHNPTWLWQLDTYYAVIAPVGVIVSWRGFSWECCFCLEVGGACDVVMWNCSYSLASSYSWKFCSKWSWDFSLDFWAPTKVLLSLHELIKICFCGRMRSENSYSIILRRSCFFTFFSFSTLHTFAYVIVSNPKLAVCPVAFLLYAKASSSSCCFYDFLFLCGLQHFYCFMSECGSFCVFSYLDFIECFGCVC